jgi:uncharacterized protein (TIGR02001 family)
MKKTIYALASFLLLTTTSHATLANDQAIDISANVGFVTEYSFRGITQSDENPAIQGGFDVAHESGIYAGIWGSNVDFNDNSEASSEMDLYAGFASSINQFSYDLGLIYYAYPGAADSLNYDFWEIALSMGYDFESFSASASVNYSPEYFGDSGDAVYYAAGVDVPLPAQFSLSGHVGHQTIDDNNSFGPDYTDWSLGLGYSFVDFDFSLQYVDTDLKEGVECAGGCDARAIFGISRTF